MHQKRHMSARRRVTASLEGAFGRLGEGLLCSVLHTGIRNFTRCESSPPHLSGLLLRLLGALIRSAAAPRQHQQLITRQ